MTSSFLLTQVLDQHPSDRPAFGFLDAEGKASWLSWEEFRNRARAVAAWLQGALPAGSPVVLLFEPGLEFNICLYACFYAGYPAIPVAVPKNLSQANPPVHLLKLMGIAKAQGLLSSKLLAPVLPLLVGAAKQMGLPLLAITADEASKAGTANFKPKKLKASDIAIIQFTSGSTAEPSGVLLNHSNIFEMSVAIKEILQLTPASRGAGWLPHTHNTGLFATILQPAFAGCSFLNMSPLSFVSKPVNWLRQLTEFQATISGAPNFAWDLCQKMISEEDMEGLDLSSLEVAFTGGEAIAPLSLRGFAKRFARVGFSEKIFVPLYGLSEATLLISGHRPMQFPRTETLNERQLISCGRTLAQLDVQIVDPDSLVSLPEGSVGEIWARGPTIAPAYVGNPVKSAMTFNARLKSGEAGFLRTGDLGMISGGELFVVGRIKETFVFSGRKFHAQDLEATLKENSKILQVCPFTLVALEQATSERLLLLVEVPDQALPVLEAEFPLLVKQLQQKNEVSLSELWMVPQASLPRTDSGKLQRFKAQALAQSEQLSVSKKLLAAAARSAAPAVQPAPATRQAQEHSLQDTAALIAKGLAQELNLPIEQLDFEQPFMELGISSLTAYSMAGELENIFKVKVSPTIFYEFPSIQALAQHIYGQVYPERRVDDRRVLSESTASSEPIAIVAYACRLPGANSASEFLKNLLNGTCSISELPSERWPREAFFAPYPGRPGKMYVTRGGFLKDSVKLFDPEHFSITPAEAKTMDPQQRLLLELCWEAMEHSGSPPLSWKGSRTGVWVGVSATDYAQLQVGRPHRYAALGNAHSICANRLSYTFDLQGPSLALDTACSSSLVSLHLACESLRRGETSAAIVGGINLMLSPELNIVFSEAQMLSPAGLCKTFDEQADGYVRGEGGVILILKRLSEAQQAGDQIYALIAGSAVNQDGHSNGITAPNRQAQVAVLREAWQKAQIKAGELHYIEAHGTGTKLGDPIEYAALVQSLQDESRSSPCLIGSVKSNIGHLEAAAGLASLLKVVLSFKSGKIPASLHFSQLNKEIRDPQPKLLQVVQENLAWPTQQRRVAGVSSFGFGGTNAHVVLFSPTPTAVAPLEKAPPGPLVLRLSARSPQALALNLKNLAVWLESESKISYPLLAEVLVNCRSSLDYRLACVVQSSEARELDRGQKEGLLREIHKSMETLNLLQLNEVKKTPEGARPGQRYSLLFGRTQKRLPKLVLLFSGQGVALPKGTPWLYQHAAVFKEVVDTCLNQLDVQRRSSIQKLLLQPESAPADLSTELFQPATYIFQVAACRWLQSCGIEADAVIGHSLGEIAAAAMCGVFTIANGLQLAVARGRLMQSTAPGRMAALMCDEAATTSLLEAFKKVHPDAPINIAATNAPRVTVISGSLAAMEAFCFDAEARGVRTRMLSVDRAFHSALMEPILEPFQAELRAFNFKEPEKAFFSTVTGQLEKNLDAAYWARQLRRPTAFMQAVESALESEHSWMLEIGGDSTLTSLVSSLRKTQKNFHALPLFDKGVAPEESLAFLLGHYWAQGWKIDQSILHAGSARSSLLQLNQQLPPAAFDRKSLWIDAVSEIKPIVPTQLAAAASPFTTGAPMSLPQQSSGPKASETSILEQICTVVCTLMGLDKGKFDPDASLLDMGADSLIMMDALAKLEDRYGVSVPVGRMFQDLTTARNLGRYIAEHAAAEPQTGHDLAAAHQVLLQNMPSSIQQVVNGSHDVRSTLISQQLQLMQAQIQLLMGAVSSPAQLIPSSSVPVQLKAAVAPARGPEPGVKDRFNAMMPDRSLQTAPLDPQRQAHLQKLIEDYNRRTAKSKAFAARSRPAMADNRSSSGFRMALKEMIYPIVMARSAGASIWDLDANQYSDFTMGFGVNLFGHNEPFIVEAIQQQLEKGFAVGPQSELVGDVSALMSKMLGLERVVFTNSGTEAVMLAVRLARAVTGRQKICIFSNSYHGTFDGILGRSRTGDPMRVGTPVAPGIPASLVQDLHVLEYGSKEALDFIQQYGTQLAAVMVEPVQSRHPENHFSSFLQEVRRLTQASGSAMIFDEVITGFRTGLGGAQEYFGVKADLATYGKVLGGGMPIGAVAGSARFIDPIDGGIWTYGDQSVPQQDLTFFAGTFCKHPLAMAAAKAVLTRLDQAQGSIQKDLNEKVSQLCSRLNLWFAQEGMAVQLASFGSLFRFIFSGNIDLFFYHMVLRGIYIWEGRNLFISTSHTEQEFAHFEKATQESLLAMREGGYLAAAQTGKK